jgi:hypothetical protein
MEEIQFASFVIRFHLAGVDEESHLKRWRIKVTDVQEKEESLFETIEEAMNYLKKRTNYT